MSNITVPPPALAALIPLRWASRDAGRMALKRKYKITAAVLGCQIVDHLHGARLHPITDDAAAIFAAYEASFQPGYHEAAPLDPALQAEGEFTAEQLAEAAEGAAILEALGPPPAPAEKVLYRTETWPYATATAPEPATQPDIPEAPQPAEQGPETPQQEEEEMPKQTKPLSAATIAASANTSIRFAIDAPGAYDIARMIAKKLGIPVVLDRDGADLLRVDPANGTAAKQDKPAKDAKPAGAPRTGGRLTQPGTKDQIAIDLALRPEGCTTPQLIEGTGWKNPAAIQDYRRIAERWGYTLDIDKSGKLAVYRLTKHQDAAAA
jgi:hypothetical protein